MSHPLEQYTVDSRSLEPLSSYATCDGVRFSDLDCNSAAWIGERTTYVRDASHNNPKDSFGWRMPSSYFASKTTYDTLGLFSWRFGPTGGYYSKCYKSDNSRRNPRWDYIVKGSSTVGRDLYFDAPPYPSGWVDYARDICRTNAMNDLKDRQVNLAVSLAEMQQTVDMIADAGRALADMILCVRRRQCGNLKRRAGGFSFANAWLQYRYGWMPLLSDIYGLYDLARKYLRGDMKRLRVRGRSKLSDDVSLHHSDESFETTRTVLLSARGQDTSACTPTYRSAPFEWRRLYRGKYFARYRLDAVLKDDMYNWLENTGVTDPLLVAWELVPYSFVADWFANIGAWIDSINAYEGLTPVSRSFTYGRELEILADYRTSTDPYYAPKVFDFQVLRPERSRFFEFTREAGVDVPSMGSLRFIRRPLNTTQLTDAMTLISQRIRG